MSEIRANLRIVKIETYSLIRTGFLISVSIAVTIFTANILMFIVLAGMGVFESIDQVLGDLTGGSAGLTETLSFPVVFLLSLAIGLFEIVVTTTLFAVFGYIYNATVPLTRGLEVTLAEDVEGDEG